MPWTCTSFSLVSGNILILAVDYRYIVSPLRFPRNLSSDSTVHFKVALSKFSILRFPNLSFGYPFLFFSPLLLFIYSFWIPFEFCPIYLSIGAKPALPFPPSFPSSPSLFFTLSVRCCEGCLRSALCPSVRCPASRPCWYGRPCAVGLCCRRAGELWCHHLHCGVEALRGPTGHHHLRHRRALRPHNHLQPHQGWPGWEVLLRNTPLHWPIYCVHTQSVIRCLSIYPSAATGHQKEYQCKGWKSLVFWTSLLKICKLPNCLWCVGLGRSMLGIVSWPLTITAWRGSR